MSRVQAETGAGAAEIVSAYRAARGVAGASRRWREIEALAGSVAADVVIDLLAGVDQLVETLTRWFIARGETGGIIALIDRYGTGFEEISQEIRTMGPKQWKNRLERKVRRLTDKGVPERIAVDHIYQVELVHAPDIIDVAANTGRSLLEAGTAFYRVGHVFHIDWLERQIESLPSQTRWQRWATLSLEQELMSLRRAIVERVLEAAGDGDVEHGFTVFVADTSVAQERLSRLMSLLRKDGVSDTAAMVVAIRQVGSLLS